MPGSRSKTAHARLFAAILCMAAMRAIAADLPEPPPAQPAHLQAADDLPRLAAMARSRDMPLVLLVSMRDCRFCEQVRTRHLVPLAAGGAVVREIAIDSPAPVIAFDGSRSTQQRQAQSLAVRVAPTVLFLDGSGREVAERLTGTMLDDFYGAYLDNALQATRDRLRAE